MGRRNNMTLYIQTKAAPLTCTTSVHVFPLNSENTTVHKSRAPLYHLFPLSLFHFNFLHHSPQWRH